MRIIDIHIDGFGIFHDLGAKSIPPAFSVLYGENEAGKTTFTAFIRAILFGFPSSRGSDNPYPPISGGQHGGTISLSMASGEKYTVERKAGPKGGKVFVTSQDGRLYGEELLRQLLGSATRDLYRNIFGFSLHELQSLEALDDEKVKATIYSAGLGIRVSLPSIETDFSNEATGLFTARGRTPVMNKILKELEEIHGQINSRYKDSSRYDELLGSRRGCESRLAELRDDQKTIGTINGRATRVLSVWEEWVEFHDAEQALARLPEINSFPVNGQSRLDTLEEKLESVTGALDDLGAEITSLERKQSSILRNDALYRASAEIEKLQRGREKFDGAVTDLPLREQDLTRARADVDESLRQLGLGWHLQRLSGFDDSIPTREIIRAYGERLQRSLSDLRALRDQQTLMEKELRDAKHKLALARRSLKLLKIPAEEDKAALRDRLGSLRNVSTLVLDRQSLTKENANLEDRIDDISEQIIFLEETTDPVSRGVAMWPGVVFSLVAVGIAALLWYGGMTYLSLATVTLASILNVVAYSLRKKLLAKRKSMLRKTKEHLKLLTLKKEEAATRASQKAVSLTVIEQSLAEECAKLEIPVQGSLPEVNRLVETAEHELEIQRDWATAKLKVDDFESDLKSLDDESEPVNEAVTKAQEANSAVERTWRAWLKTTGLLPTVSPDGALEILSAIRLGKERIVIEEDLRRRVKEIRTYSENYSLSIQHTASSCGIEFTIGMNPGQQADKLVQLAGDEEANRKTLGTIEETLTETRQHRKVLEGKKGRIEQGLATLFTEAEVESADAFTTRGDNWTKRLALEQKCSSRKVAIEKVGGVGKQGDEFMTLLRGADLVEQQETKTATDSHLEEIGKQIELTITDRATVDEQIRVFESETETSDLRLREQCLIEQLSLNAQKWSLFTVAQCLLARTRDKYERERQPSVIRDAVSFFEPITGGRYDHILAEPGKVGFHVLDRDGSRKGVAELSGGTREQLYFAVRLGLIREFGKRLEPLPVILDDVFVNFDPIRAKAALHATFGLSKSHQVLLLTCHPETVQLISAEDPETPILDIDHEESAVKSVPAHEWLLSYSAE